MKNVKGKINSICHILFVDIQFDYNLSEDRVNGSTIGIVYDGVLDPIRRAVWDGIVLEINNKIIDGIQNT